MIRVKVDKADPTDLYEQVAAEIRRAIADGEATPGERLPPAKDLAAVLGVNANTVLRALRLLRDEGLLEFRRGRGISVAGTPERGAVINKHASSSTTPAATATASTSSSRSSKASPDALGRSLAGNRGRPLLPVMQRACARQAREPSFLPRTRVASRAEGDVSTNSGSAPPERRLFAANEDPKERPTTREWSSSAARLAGQGWIWMESMMACRSATHSGGAPGDVLATMTRRVPSTSRIQNSSVRPASGPLYAVVSRPTEEWGDPAVEPRPGTLRTSDRGVSASQVGDGEHEVLALVAEERHVARRRGHLEGGKLAERGGEVIDAWPDGWILRSGIEAGVGCHVRHRGDAQHDVRAVGDLAHWDPLLPLLGGDLEGDPQRRRGIAVGIDEVLPGLEARRRPCRCRSVLRVRALG